METSQQLEQSYQNLKSKRKSLDTMRSSYGEELGLNKSQDSLKKVRQTIFDTEKILENAPRDVRSRSRQLGGPVTSAMTNRLTVNAQNPIISQLGDLSKKQGIEEAGINSITDQVNQRLALEQVGRQATDADFIRRINNAMQSEAEARARSAAMASQGPSLSEILNNLMGGDGGQVAGAVSGKPVDLVAKRNNYLGSDTNAFNWLAKGIQGAGEAFYRLTPRGNESIEENRKYLNEVYGQNALNKATQIRTGLDNRAIDVVTRFLKANPQFKGQVRSTGDISRLQRAKVKINKF